MHSFHLWSSLSLFGVCCCLQNWISSVPAAELFGCFPIFVLSFPSSTVTVSCKILLKDPLGNNKPVFTLSHHNGQTTFTQHTDI